MAQNHDVQSLDPAEGCSVTFSVFQAASGVFNLKDNRTLGGRHFQVCKFFPHI